MEILGPEWLQNGIIGYKLPFRTVYCFYWIVSQYYSAATYYENQLKHKKNYFQGESELVV